MASDRKRKRGTKFTKHRKAGWKSADVADIEEAIDERRESERLGFDKNSAFFIDDSVKKPDSEQAVHPSKPKFRKLNGQISTDSVLDGFRLRCFATLEAQSAIPALPSQSRTRTVVESARKVAKLAASGEKHRKKLEQRRRDPTSRYYDLWESADSTNVKKVDNEDSKRGVTKLQKGSEVNSQGKLQSSGRKRRGLELPHAGQSYNPVSEDHAALLNVAYQSEQRKVRAAARLERSLKAARTNSADIGDDVHVADGNESDAAENEAPKQTEGEGAAKTRPVRESAKPKRTREQKERRAREQIVREAERQFAKERARTSAQATQVVAIRKEIDRAEREHVRLRNEAAKNKRVKPVKLGPFRYEEDDLVIKLPEELGVDAESSSLRRLRPEGNLLRDRFCSMQRRGIVEVRHRAQVRRKFAPKYIERKSTQNMLSRKLAALAH